MATCSSSVSMYFPGIPTHRSACTKLPGTFPWMLISAPVSALRGNLAEDVAAGDFCAALAKASGSPRSPPAR